MTAEAPVHHPLVSFACSLLPLLVAMGCATTPDDPFDRAGDAVRGHVFVDRDGDGERDENERGVAGVAVSDGEQVTWTDRQGRWALPARDRADYFVIKPTGMRTPLDANGLPRFYYLQRKDGSPRNLEHRGLAATGAPPRQLDFPLYPQEETSPFRVLVVGDPQPRTLEQVDHFAHDILPELAASDAAFGVSLGDIVHDDLALFPPMIEAIGLVGIPWFHVFGNHDMNFDALDRETAGATFERFFGPRNFAFEYADVHFIVLDNIDFRPASEDEPVGYRGGLTERTLRFIENYLEGVPRDEQIVFMMHIPLVGDERNQVPQRDRLFEILAEHEHHWSISAHTHTQSHRFVEMGNGTHHHWNSSTASGSWWRGRRDEVGIPHTTMRDGSPNGYSIVTFDGADYSIRFKAARRPADHQIEIGAPAEVVSGSRREIHANVFAGSERSRVEVRVRDGSPRSEVGDEGWRPLERTLTVDPAFRALRRRELDALAADERSLPNPNPSQHLWRGELHFDLEPGSYWIEVRSRDMFGQVDIARRVVRVVEAAEARAPDAEAPTQAR